MFSEAELCDVTGQQWFKEGYGQLERNLLLHRLGLRIDPLSEVVRRRLKRFSQAVIASAPSWSDPRASAGRNLCQLAGDIEASLSISEPVSSHLSLLKAILLYELGGLPGASASYASRNGFDQRFRDFFSRSGDSVWGTVASTDAELHRRVRPDVQTIPQDLDAQIEQSLGELTQEAGLQIQRDLSGDAVKQVLAALRQIAEDFDIGLSGDDFAALGRLLRLRSEASTLSVIPALSTLEKADVRAIFAPVELWPAQVEALRSGLLSPSIRSFGFAAPTGTGKTALTRLLIADALDQHPDRKVLYVCPSRALVHQVWADLDKALVGLRIRVFEAGGHIVFNEHAPVASEDADVLVFTPERADLLLRVDHEFLSKTCLIVVDEAHHIEQGSRGVLLEFYLWRLSKLISADARIVQLSAVAPNINELTDWLAPPGEARALKVEWRTTRLRVGLLERTTRGGAILKIGDTAPYQLLPDGNLPKNPKEGLAYLANHLAENGIVLVLCMSPGSAEEAAQLAFDLRSEEQSVDDEVSERLDAWVERELYPESPLRKFYRKRVVFHHSQMPPRVRIGIEESIRAKKVDLIFATTTLAEGVNFPFSTVLVESLVGRNYQLSPRALWNIAGRAGRFGVDSEGHCILFRPELWASKLTDYALSDYLKSALDDIPPVKSALATGIEKLEDLVRTGKVEIKSLNEISLSGIKVDGKATDQAKNIRAFLNIMRVGYAHASASGAVDLENTLSPELDHELLAARQIRQSTKAFATSIGEQQRSVVRKATKDNAEFVRIAAKVGWSLEAQQILYDWLTTRTDWQLDQFGHIVVGGRVTNPNNLGYLIGPVTKSLIAFEGEALGGSVSYVAQKWISGIPLSSFQLDRGASFGRLINNVYGKMQYLLPWGLFGVHELIQYVAAERGILVADGVNNLSVLAAEGVPDFDALNLVLKLGIERVDATRLSKRYNRKDPSSDITQWFAHLSWPEVERAVRGQDQRRIDPSLRALHRHLSEVQSHESG